MLYRIYIDQFGDLYWLYLKCGATHNKKNTISPGNFIDLRLTKRRLLQM